MDSSIVCSNCKTPNPSSNLFCQSCGSRIGGATAQPPAQGVNTIPVYPPTQQPAAYPQATPAAYPQQGYQAYQPQPVYMPPTLKSLGVKVDEFTEVFAGMGERAAEVGEEFTKSMNDKGLPGVSLSQSVFVSGRMHRTYKVANHASGATMVSSINPAGKDLEVSWMLYVRRILNWIPLAIMGGVALLLPLAWSFVSSFFITAVYIVSLVLLLVLGILGAMLVGKVLKDNTWWAFIIEMDDMAWEDTNVMQTAIHDELMKAVEKVQSTPVKKASADTSKTRTVTKASKTK